MYLYTEHSRQWQQLCVWHWMNWFCVCSYCKCYIYYSWPCSHRNCSGIEKIIRKEITNESIGFSSVRVWAFGFKQFPVLCGQSLVAINGEVISQHEGLRVYNCTWLKRQGPMAWQSSSRCLAVGWEQLDPRLCRHRGTTASCSSRSALFILLLSKVFTLIFCTAICAFLFFSSFFGNRKSQHEQRKEQEPKRPHIKKPLNAFMLYMKEMRANVVAECTLKESAAINQILGRRVGHIRSLLFSCCSVLLHNNLYHQKKKKYRVLNNHS